MSYTKFAAEVTKWLKANQLPWRGRASDSAEATRVRLDAWQTGSREMLGQWLAARRYKELISCAQSGWYKEDEFFVPLAEYFAKEKLLAELKCLCERGIKHEADCMLTCVKLMQENGAEVIPAKLIHYDVAAYKAAKKYDDMGEVAKYRMKTLENIDRYTGYLHEAGCSSEYLEMIQVLKAKVFDLALKAGDLKKLNSKL